jgi:hypothetical protein
MAWGGDRKGDKWKKQVAKKTNPNKPIARAETKLKPSTQITVAAEPKSSPAIDPRAWAMMLPEIEAMSQKYSVRQERTAENNPFRLPEFPRPLVERLKSAKLPTMAMDNALVGNLSAAGDQWLAGGSFWGMPGEGLLFLGYTYLSELAQRPEYRVMSETIADDATRKGIDFDVVGDDQQQQEDRKKDPFGFDEKMADPDERQKRIKKAGKLDKIKALKDDQIRLEVMPRLYEMFRGDGFFGRMHLFLDIRDPAKGDDINQEELKSPIGDSRDETSKTKCQKGWFQGLRSVEPVWTYPLMYNAINPLRKDWYSPQTWYVMGQEIHGTRLQTFIGHPVPDMLKPAYSFGGLSLTQMAKPYVDIWLQTRKSVAQLIHSFSVMVLMTDLSTLMQPGNVGALLARVAAFNMLRDNQRTYVVNKNTEDFKNVSASLSGLHELQAQSQEHIFSVVRIPAVKFTGIQPAGLNSSSEGEIETYDDSITALQMRFADPNLRRIINFQQLSLFGEIDPQITHRWEPLREMTDAERGQKQKDEADRDDKYVAMGALSPELVFHRIINDKDLPYTELSPDDVPDLLSEEEEGLEPEGGKPQPQVDGGGDKPDDDKGGEANDADLPFASDAAFNESEHPRAPDGKFGSGGGGGGSKPARLTPTEKAYLDSYSGDEFLKLNTKLREGDASSPAVAKLDSAIAKTTVAPGTKLYRGISKDALKQLIKGDVINAGQALEDPGFLSTSTDRNIAGLNSIGGVVMEIEVGEGQHGLDMGQISRNQHEKEVVLPRNSKMKVLGLRAPKKPGDPIIVRVATENG